MTAPDLRTAAAAYRNQTRAAFSHTVWPSSTREAAERLDAALAAEATEPPADDGHDPEAVMPRVNGKPFRCPCGGNVFTRRGSVYTCNSCRAEYEGTPAAGSAPNPQGADEPHRARIEIEWHPSASIGERAAVKRLLESKCAVLMDTLLDWDVVDPAVSLSMDPVGDDRRAAAVGVPDEPGDDDPILTTQEVAQARADGGDRLGWVLLLADSHEALRAEVERLRAEAPASEDDEPATGSFVLVLPGYYEEVARRLAAAGSPPPTPAPTDDDRGLTYPLIREIRQQVAEAIAGNIGRDCDDVDAAADAVMSLLSAEPAPPLWTGETKQRAHITDSSVIDVCVPVPVPPGTAVEVREKQP